jgi:hypothetical protein
MWVRKWLSDKKRERNGHYSTLLTELRTEDGKAFYTYTKLPRGLYDEVLRRVEGRIEKKDTWYRKSLPPSLKLSITLRHLACGDNYPSLSYNFSSHFLTHIDLGFLLRLGIPLPWKIKSKTSTLSNARKANSKK